MGRRWILVLGVAACGRYHFDALGDGTDASGSGDGAAAANVVFVTSSRQLPTTFGADFAGADAICNMRAAEAGLPGQGSFVAWLSTSTIDARNRLAAARGWVRTDGLPFADTVEDIVAGKIFYPINRDENGIDVTPDFVLTGTGDDGLVLPNCTNYSDAGQMIYFGRVEATAHGWTHESSIDCATPGRIYCFGTSRSQQVSVRPVSGRIAFLSTQSFAPNTGGLPSADLLCNSEAMSAGLPGAGTYRALLATTTTTALSRVSVSGATWVRTDGVPLAASATDFSNGVMTAPLNVTASQTYRIANAFTGASSLTALSPSAAEVCGDWTTTAGTGVVGLPSYIDSTFFYVSYITRSCAAGPPIYCLQQ